MRALLSFLQVLLHAEHAEEGAFEWISQSTRSHIAANVKAVSARNRSAVARCYLKLDGHHASTSLDHVWSNATQHTCTFARTHTPPLVLQKYNMGLGSRTVAGGAYQVQLR